MPVRLILFDLDGTLVDSRRDIANALNHALLKAGLRELSLDETVSIVGDGAGELIRKALAIAGKAKWENSFCEAVLASFLDYYTGHFMDCTTTYTNVPEVLEALSACTKAVITNKPERLAEILLDGLRLSRHFALVCGPESCQEKKPSPKPLLHAMEHLGVSPKQTVMVGDSPTDIEAGKQAGVRTIGVAYGYRPASSLAEADYLVRDDIGELLPLLRYLDGQG